VRRDDPRHEVERERTVADGAVGRRQVERDPLAHEQGVAQLAGRHQPLAAEPLELGHERLGVVAAGPVGREDLVVAVGRQSAGAHPHIVHRAASRGCATAYKIAAPFLYAAAARHRRRVAPSRRTARGAAA
jgi:hypothetical protein